MYSRHTAFIHDCRVRIAVRFLSEILQINHLQGLFLPGWLLLPAILLSTGLYPAWYQHYLFILFCEVQHSASDIGC